MSRIVQAIMIFMFTAQIFCQSDESSNLTYGMKLYNDKIFDVAVTQFKSFMEQYGSSVSAPKVQYYLAEAYLALNDKENALKNYQKLILDYPKSEFCEAAIIKTADLHKENGELEKSARYYLQLKNYFPSSSRIPECYYKAIALFNEAGMAENAKDNAALLNKTYPKNNFTKLSQLILAEIYEKEGQPALADRIYSDVLRSASGEITASAGLKYSDFLLRQNDVSGAKRTLRSVFKETSAKDDSYYPVLIKLSEILLLSGGYEEALKIVDTERSVPENYKKAVLNIKGDAEFFKKDYNKALLSFEQALGSGKDPLLEMKIAHTLSALNQFEKSGDVFLIPAGDKTFIEKDPDIVRTALLNSSENYFKAKKHEKGIGALQKYLELFPGDQASGKINYMIGRSYFDSGKYASAYEILRDHFLSFPSSVFADDAVFSCAESAFKLQNWEKAYEQYDLLIKMYGASEFRSISETRIKYLLENKLRSPELNDKLADLASRSSYEENKQKLFLDWSRFYFNDMKDYVRAGEFLERYVTATGNRDNGTEVRFIRAVCKLRLKEKEKDELKTAADILRGIISDPNSQKNWKFKACSELLSIADKIWEANELSSIAGETMEAVQREQLDDPDGTLSFRYFQLKTKNSKQPDLINKINSIFKTKTGSVYYDAATYMIASLYRADGNVSASDELLKNLSRSPDAQIAFKSLNTLADSPNEKAENRITYLNTIAANYFYASDPAGLSERKAGVFASDGKYEKALAIYSELQNDIDKGNISSSWSISDRDYSKFIADIYFKMSDLRRAETFYQKALIYKNSGSEKQYILQKLSEIYRKQNNQTALEENFRALSSLTGGSSGYEAALALADIEAEKGNYDKAIAQYNEIMKKSDPSDKKAVEAKIINSTYAKQHITQADGLLKEFQKKHKDSYDREIFDPEFYLSKANAFLSLNDNDKALKAYKALLSDFPKSLLVPKALYGQAVCLYNIGKKDEAFEIWKNVVDKYPEDEIAVETSYHLGAIYNNREEFDKAIESFQKIIKYPKDHRLKKNTYKNIIDLYLKLGFNDAGGKLIREYISKYPDEDDVFQKRIEIGNIYQRNEEYDTALDYFKRLLFEAKGDDEAACQFFIAETYMMMKNYRQAITEFLKVKYLSKTDSPFEWKLTSIYKTALCYEELNEFDKALELLNQIAKDHAADSYGRQAKKVIERIEEKKNILK
ncbi:MAG TPA: tetratricopeptide repeat protein [Clostridiales bacterium]|nr:tetratricopeptide repeat protein [Clostridiales bacterium]HQP70002.1 tetratricopeptide repeat protein [Clostridiales bacterium]